jgi:hypothetical protein
MIHRTALFAGVALAAAGTVMLIGVNDATAGDAILSALRLWPLALIAVGVALLARRTRFAVAGTLVAALIAGVLVGGAAVAAPELPSICHDRDAVSLPTRSGTFDRPATVELDLACGDLEVSTIDGADWRLDTLDLGGRSAVVESGPDALVVRNDHDGMRGFGRQGDTWQLGLPRALAFDLDAEVNAGRGRLDLAGATIGTLELEVNAGETRLDLGTATVTDLAVDVNAGSVTVLLPAAADLVGDLDVSAGAIEICAPAGLGLRMHGDADFGRTQFNGLVRVGDAWETPDLSTATYLAELNVSAQAGSVVVNPAGGCK